MTEQEKQPRYFYVGQTVYESEFGEGIVIDINFKCEDRPILVNFEYAPETAYTYDGRPHPGYPVTLSQTPIPEIQNEPLPEMPDLEPGDVVVCWDNDKESAIIGIFKSFSPNEEHPYEAIFQPGKTFSSWSVYKNCEKYDPEKYYQK